ncbi:MAG: hypothetical protein HYZ28_21630 [Myxococcales bacterium]|nr:hypothetical protein [Myxococcales bacterium]
MRPEEELRAEREARIAELESRLSRRSPVGVKAPVAALAIGIAIYLLWEQRLEIAYLFAPREPISLGTEGDYQLDRLASNRYAQVHGIPTSRGAYSVEGERTFVVVGLRETPLLVRREALPGETWKPGSVPPRPNQSPFAVRGRLLSRAGAARFEDGFKKLEEAGEVRPAWILFEGERPGRSVAALLWLGGLSAFILANAWLLYREAAHRLSVRRRG